VLLWQPWASLEGLWRSRAGRWCDIRCPQLGLQSRRAPIDTRKALALAFERPLARKVQIVLGLALEPAQPLALDCSPLQGDAATGRALVLVLRLAHSGLVCSKRARPVRPSRFLAHPTRVLPRELERADHAERPMWEGKRPEVGTEEGGELAGLAHTHERVDRIYLGSPPVVLVRPLLELVVAERLVACDAVETSLGGSKGIRFAEGGTPCGALEAQTCLRQRESLVVHGADEGQGRAPRRTRLRCAHGVWTAPPETRTSSWVEGEKVSIPHYIDTVMVK
jgi:hypothetical protein